MPKAKPEPFPARLKSLREAAGLTQARLAAAADLHPQTVAQYEQGSRTPGLNQLLALAVALGVTLDRLAGR